MKDELLQLSTNRVWVVSNYRKTFDQQALKELAKSIKEKGVIEPLICRDKNGVFELIAGERRLKAAKMAGVATVPVIVKQNVSDEDFYEMQLIENMQREDVHFMEEARGLNDLRENCDLNMSEIAKKIGKSENYLYQMLSCLKMGDVATEAAENGELTKSATVRIAKLPTIEMQNEAAHDLRRKTKDKLLSLRAVNRYLQEKFGEDRYKQPKRNLAQKENGNDYALNWKKYLVNFSEQQFKYFKAICRGRTENVVITQAVEQVMLESAELKKKAAQELEFYEVTG